MAAKPKRANLKPPGRCIFCGHLGLTGEHMWANWLRKYIPREMQEHRMLSTIVSATDRVETIKKRTGDPHSRKIKCVCGGCNSGWMGQLQEDAKPYLVPMLTGQRATLHRKAQIALAAWAAMTVMVAEHVDSEMIAIPESDRRFLHANRYPPSHWRIWIGRHQRQQHPLFCHNVLPIGTEEELKRLPRKTTAGPNSQTSTICVGEQLLIHVMSSEVGRSYIRRWKLPQLVTPAVSQIWPVRNRVIAWPLAGTLSDAGIDLLAQQFFSAAASFAKEWPGAD